MPRRAGLKTQPSSASAREYVAHQQPGSIPLRGLIADRIARAHQSSHDRATRWHSVESRGVPSNGPMQFACPDFDPRFAAALRMREPRHNFELEITGCGRDEALHTGSLAHRLRTARPRPPSRKYAGTALVNGSKRLATSAAPATGGAAAAGSDAGPGSSPVTTG